MSIFDQKHQTAGALTPESFAAFIQAVENQPQHPCRRGEHVVSPRELERGYGLCANCGSPVGKWPYADA